MALILNLNNRAAVYAIFNLKVLFIGSIILFEAASALCGAAPTMDALIVGRAIAGVGGTGIFLGCVIVTWNRDDVLLTHLAEF